MIASIRSSFCFLGSGRGQLQFAYCSVLRRRRFHTKYLRTYGAISFEKWALMGAGRQMHVSINYAMKKEATIVCLDRLVIPVDLYKYRTY